MARSIAARLRSPRQPESAKRRVYDYCHTSRRPGNRDPRSAQVSACVGEFDFRRLMQSFGFLDGPDRSLPREFF